MNTLEIMMFSDIEIIRCMDQILMFVVEDVSKL